MLSFDYSQTIICCLHDLTVTVCYCIVICNSIVFFSFSLQLTQHSNFFRMVLFYCVCDVCSVAWIFDTESFANKSKPILFKGTNKRSHIWEHQPPDWPSPWQQSAHCFRWKWTVSETACDSEIVNPPKKTFSQTWNLKMRSESLLQSQLNYCLMTVTWWVKWSLGIWLAILDDWRRICWYKWHDL